MGVGGLPLHVGGFRPHFRGVGGSPELSERTDRETIKKQALAADPEAVQSQRVELKGWWWLCLFVRTRHVHATT